MAIQLNNISDFNFLVRAISSPADYRANKNLLEFVPFAAMDKFVQRLMLGSTIKEAYAEALGHAVSQKSKG